MRLAKAEVSEQRGRRRAAGNAGQVGVEGGQVPSVPGAPQAGQRTKRRAPSIRHRAAGIGHQVGRRAGGMRRADSPTTDGQSQISVPVQEKRGLFRESSEHREQSGRVPANRVGLVPGSLSGAQASSAWHIHPRPPSRRPSSLNSGVFSCTSIDFGDWKRENAARPRARPIPHARDHAWCARDHARIRLAPDPIHGTDADVAKNARSRGAPRGACPPMASNRGAAPDRRASAKASTCKFAGGPSGRQLREGRRAVQGPRLRTFLATPPANPWIGRVPDSRARRRGGQRPETGREEPCGEIHPAGSFLSGAISPASHPRGSG